MRCRPQPASTERYLPRSGEKKKDEPTHRRGRGYAAMPGLHLHRGMRRGEERRSGPDVVSVRDKDRAKKKRRD